MGGDIEEGDSSTTSKAWYMWRTHTQAVPSRGNITAFRDDRTFGRFQASASEGASIA